MELCATCEALGVCLTCKDSKRDGDNCDCKPGTTENTDT